MSIWRAVCDRPKTCLGDSCFCTMFATVAAITANFETYFQVPLQQTINQLSSVLVDGESRKSQNLLLFPYTKPWGTESEYFFLSILSNFESLNTLTLITNQQPSFTPLFVGGPRLIILKPMCTQIHHEDKGQLLLESKWYDTHWKSKSFTSELPFQTRWARVRILCDLSWKPFCHDPPQNHQLRHCAIFLLSWTAFWHIPRHRGPFQHAVWFMALVLSQQVVSNNGRRIMYIDYCRFKICWQFPFDSGLLINRHLIYQRLFVLTLTALELSYIKVGHISILSSAFPLMLWMGASKWPKCPSYIVPSLETSKISRQVCCRVKMDFGYILLVIEINSPGLLDIFLRTPQFCDYRDQFALQMLVLWLFHLYCWKPSCVLFVPHFTNRLCPAHGFISLFFEKLIFSLLA